MKVVLFIGQSLGVEFFSLAQTPGAVPVADTHMWNGSAWVAPTGDGAITYCNDLKSVANEPIYVINACVGGTPLLPLSGSPYWLDTSAGSLVNNAIAHTQAALATLPSGTILDRIECWHGQTDSTSQAYPDLYTAFKNGLYALLGLLRTGLGNDFRFCVWPVGKVNAGSIMEVVRAQMVFSEDVASGVEPGPASYDMSYRDSLHLVAASYAAMGMRAARNAWSYFVAKANAAAGTPHYGSGPRVTAVCRLGSTLNVFMLGITAKNGFCLSPGNAWSGQVTMSGFGGWWANSLDSIAITEAKLVGGRIRLETGSTIINGSVRGGYWWERGCSADAPVYDSYDLFYPGWGQPLLPHTPEMMASD